MSEWGIVKSSRVSQKKQISQKHQIFSNTNGCEVSECSVWYQVGSVKNVELSQKHEKFLNTMGVKLMITPMWTLVGSSKKMQSMFVIFFVSL